MTVSPERVAVSRRTLGLAFALLAVSLGGALAAVRLLSPRPEPEPDLSPGGAPAEPAGTVSASGDAPALAPGLRAEYFALDRSPEDFPVLDLFAVPALARVDRQVNFGATTGGFARTALVDRFFVCWTGVLRVPRAGRYRFFTRSDDGSRLFLDHRLVVDNGGVHESRERAGEVELAAGDHDLRLEYFEAAGPAACALGWEGPGVAKDVIPEDVLFHRE
jgi:hypothetical protein